MTILAICGFEAGDFSEVPTVVGSPTVVSTSPITGSYMMRCNTASTTAYITIDPSTSAITFRIKITTLPNHYMYLCGLIGANSSNDIIGLDSTGALYLGPNSASTILSTGTMYRLAAGMSSLGNSILWVNGTQVATRDLGAGVGFRTIGVMSNATADFYIDDIVQSNPTSALDLGNYSVLPSVPNASGDIIQFTPTGTTTNWSAVNAIPFDDTKYNTATATTAKEDTYNLQDSATIGLPGTASIGAVSYDERLSWGRVSTAAMLVRSGGTDYTINSFANNTSARAASFTLVCSSTSPSGGAWTQALFDGTQIGFSAGKSSTCRILETWAMVAYFASATSGTSYTMDILDSMIATDLIRPQRTMGMGISDAMKSGDTLAPARTMGVSELDAMVMSDLAQAAKAFYITESDALVFQSSTPGLGLTINPVIADSIVTSGTNQLNGTFNMTIANTIITASPATLNAVMGLLAQDAMVTGDTAKLNMIAVITAQDSLVVSDVAAILNKLYPVISSNLIFTDLAQEQNTLTIIIPDSHIFTDAILLELAGGPILMSLSDALVTASNLKFNTNVIMNIPDAMTASDLVRLMNSLQLALSDQGVFADVANLSTTINITVSSTVELQTTIGIIMQLAMILTDNFTAGDLLTMTGGVVPGSNIYFTVKLGNRTLTFVLNTQTLTLSLPNYALTMQTMSHNLTMRTANHNLTLSKN